MAIASPAITRTAMLAIAIWEKRLPTRRHVFASRHSCSAISR